MSTLIRELNQEVDRTVSILERHPRASVVIGGDADADALARYYASAHEAVRHATSLLEQSHLQLKADAGDPELIELLWRKVLEESGHDRWLEADLFAIGRPLGSVNAPEPTAASRLYTRFHREVIPLNGHAFLGTAYMLESLATRCAGTAAKNLQSRARIPGIAPGSRTGLSFLFGHHEEDIGHVAEMARLIERFVVDPAAQRYVMLCARFTGTVYPDFF
jgi:hypothetical protein